MALTPRQERFVREYVECLNATESAKRAGYNPKTAYNQGYRLLRMPDVQAEIQKYMEKLESEKIASATEILEFLTRQLRREEDESYVLQNGTVVHSKTANQNAIRSAELLGKRYQLFTDNLVVDGDMNLNVKIQYEDEADG